MRTARWWALVVTLSLVAGGATAAAMRHMSATFDEIVLVAGGLRGLEHGQWDMITGQPPLMMYAYGAAARTASPRLPPEKGEVWGVERGWEYAQTLFFRLGNDPVLVLDRARLVGAALVVLLVLAAGLYGAWMGGPTAGALAALLVAAIPDVLAHGGVAYNDLPLALAFLVALWAMDAAVRRPSPARGAVAAVTVGLALGVKFSALALAPVALLLVAAEATVRPRDRQWWIDLGVSVVVGLLALWATLMLLYRGDPTLTLFRLGFLRTVLHTEGGHPGAAYLLGRTSATGWWYFYPVVFLFKTPAAFQGLLVVGALGLVRALRRRDGGAGARWRSVARWRGRGAMLGAAVFGTFLMASHLDSGFRYALPVLPLLAVLAAPGLARVWERSVRGRVVVGVLVAFQIASVASVYPDFLAYTSVWAGGRDRADRVLLDSSLDWGQGLLELRRFMSEEGVGRVRLSYFGSAMPSAYGIDYVPLPSFFRLQNGEDGGPPPRFTVISATTLHGLYLQGHDPFASYRSRVPYRVLGHTLFVYDDGHPAAGAASSSTPGGDGLPPSPDHR